MGPEIFNYYSVYSRHLFILFTLKNVIVCILTNLDFNVILVSYGKITIGKKYISVFKLNNLGIFNPWYSSGLYLYRIGGIQEAVML